MKNHTISTISTTSKGRNKRNKKGIYQKDIFKNNATMQNYISLLNNTFEQSEKSLTVEREDYLSSEDNGY